jgi:hypothetical protein
MLRASLRHLSKDSLPRGTCQEEGKEGRKGITTRKKGRKGTAVGQHCHRGGPSEPVQTTLFPVGTPTPDYCIQPPQMLSHASKHFSEERQFPHGDVCELLLAKSRIRVPSSDPQLRKEQNQKLERKWLGGGVPQTRQSCASCLSAIPKIALKSQAALDTEHNLHLWNLTLL